MFARGFTKAVERLIVTAGKRIQADFSNSVVSSRMLFQSFTKDSPTSVGAVPNGASPYANFTAFASSNPDQSALIQMAATDTEMVINSARTGSASYLPLSFYTGGLLRLRVDTYGNRLLYQESAGTFSTDSFQMNDASGSKQRALARQIINESGFVVSSINQYVNTDGSSTITFTGSRAGARNSYREVTDWTIDSSGRLLNSANSMPSFSASSFDKMTGEGNSTMIFGIIGHNTGSAYNSSTGSFTAPVTGFYQFSFNCYLVRTTLGVANHTFELRKNGSIVHGSSSATRIGDTGSAITTYGSASFCVPLYLTAGDVVTVYHGGNAWASDGSGNITEAGFHGMLLR